MTQTGYPEPGYTQTPNLLFDEHMQDMSEVELKVVLCAVRKTLGWHRQRDVISLTQFQRMTGLSRKGVLLGIERAIERGVLEQVGNGVRGAVIYQLCIFSTTGEQNTPVVNDQAKSYTSTGKRSTPDLVNDLDTQKKRTKEKEQKKGSASTAVESSNTPPAENDLSAALTLYEQNIGLRTPIIDQELTDLFDDYGGEWLCGAIRYAITQEKRSLAYVIGTLAGWKRDGRGTKAGNGRTGAAKPGGKQAARKSVYDDFAEQQKRSHNALRDVDGNSLLKE